MQHAAAGTRTHIACPASTLHSSAKSLFVNTKHKILFFWLRLRCEKQPKEDSDIKLFAKLNFNAELSSFLSVL